MIKRYTLVVDDRWPYVKPPDIIECEAENAIVGFCDTTADGFGEWVKYDDVKHLLERSDNSGYESALYKLLDDCIDEHYRETVKSVSDIVKEIQSLNASHFA